MKMFTIRDVKSDGYNTPFFQPTYGLAERAFNEACKDPQSMISKYPEDFSLFYLGEFDPQTGLVKLEATPKLVTEAPKTVN